MSTQWARELKIWDLEQSTLCDWKQSKESVKKGSVNNLPEIPGSTCVSLVAQKVKHLHAMWETWVQSLGWEDPPPRRHGKPLQHSCLENPHGQRSLTGYSPWGLKDLSMTVTKHILSSLLGRAPGLLGKVEMILDLDVSRLFPFPLLCNSGQVTEQSPCTEG